MYEKRFKQQAPSFLNIDAVYAHTVDREHGVDTYFMNEEAEELFSISTVNIITLDGQWWKTTVESNTDRLVFRTDIAQPKRIIHDALCALFVKRCNIQRPTECAKGAKSAQVDCFIDRMTSLIIEIDTELSFGNVEQARELAGQYVGIYHNHHPDLHPHVLSPARLLSRVQRVVENQLFVDSCLIRQRFHVDEHGQEKVLMRALL